MFHQLPNILLSCCHVFMSSIPWGFGVLQRQFLLEKTGIDSNAEKKMRKKKLVLVVDAADFTVWW